MRYFEAMKIFSLAKLPPLKFASPMDFACDNDHYGVLMVILSLHIRTHIVVTII